MSSRVDCDIGYAQLAERLVEQVAAFETTEEVVAGVGQILAATALHVERVFVSISALHPAVRARTYLWEPGASWAQMIEWPHGLENRPGYYESPDYHVHRTGTELRVQLAKDKHPHACDLYGQLADQGFADYLIVPLQFVDGTINTLSVATRRQAGFSDKDLYEFRRLIALLTLIFERRAALETLSSVIDTYLEHDAGQQVLRGNIQAGDGQLIAAAILMADLRGFTRLAASLSPSETVSFLNSYFDCLVGPIRQNGGHVLKFIGDAVLAFFPDVPAGGTVTPLAAVSSIRDRLATLNRDRKRANSAALSHALCLHYGQVVYGNIGATDRLDFTIIGDAVNLAARGCELAKRLDAEYVFTQAFVDKFGGEGLTSLGSHKLRDLSTPVTMFTLKR